MDDRPPSDTGTTKYSAVETLISCIRNGVTTVFDHHASFGRLAAAIFTIADVAKELGVRACLCYEISDRDGMDKPANLLWRMRNFIRYALKDDTDMIAGYDGYACTVYQFPMQPWNWQLRTNG